MAQYNTITTLDGYFKEIYADKLNNLIPDNDVLKNRIPFSVKDRIGKGYNQPVKVAGAGGITFAASGAGAFSINTPIAGQTQNAVVDGSQILIAEDTDYESVAKAAGNKQAFAQTVGFVVDGMIETATKLLEIEMRYGQKGLGQISAVSGTGTSRTVTLSNATWCSVIWSGCKGWKFNIHNGTTFIGGGTATAADSLYTIDTISIADKQITFTCTTTGGTALDTAVSSGDTLDIYYYDAYGKEMAGLQKIMTTTSGNLFSIDTASYELWVGNSSNVNGAISLEKLFAGLDEPIARGCMSSGFVCLNPKKWRVLMDEMAALRRYDSSYKVKNADYGHTEPLMIHTAAGVAEVIPDIYCKEGDGFFIPRNKFQRIGATDFSFTLPGKPNDKFFFEKPSNAGFELRIYSHQALFTSYPAHTVYFYGIT